MHTIDHFNLRSFDLNLLIAFDAMMQELSVTRAAAKLRIGQPAMSHSLSTLRLLLQDELFVRVGQRMQPTARARALAVPIRMALQQAQSALSERDSFCPETEQRTFRLGLSGEMELLLLPDLVACIQSTAPGIKFLSRTATPGTVDAMLDAGEIDVAIGCSDYLASRYRGESLMDAEVACCFNPSLLPFRNPLDRDTYLGARHAVLSQSDSIHGCIREALEHIGVTLDVVMAAPDFMPVLSAASQTALVATVPRRIGERYGPMLGLQVSPVPLALNFPPVNMIWPVHVDKDPSLVWLRAQIRQVLSGLASDPSVAVAASTPV
ncbi:LysR family transcriptional regulator [Billgrantia saliphila]|uniref:LysR family transcriptional regulator n=1 Tax=Billgrantia saliphila TaxID=1848458 RepID=UPI000CE41AD1|nr:LysR family transcriptional regulator [Halomonas saliphila]